MLTVVYGGLDVISRQMRKQVQESNLLEERMDGLNGLNEQKIDFLHESERGTR